MERGRDRETERLGDKKTRGFGEDGKIRSLVMMVNCVEV